MAVHFYMQRSGVVASSAQSDERGNGVSGVDSNDSTAAATNAAPSEPNGSTVPTSDLPPGTESTAAVPTEAPSEPSGEHEAVAEDSGYTQQQEPDPTAGAAHGPPSNEPGR